MLLLSYKFGGVHKSEWIPVGGAMCGRGVHSILLDLQDFERIADMLRSGSAVEREVIADYLCTLPTRFVPGKHSHKEVMSG